MEFELWICAGKRTRIIPLKGIDSKVLNELVKDVYQLAWYGIIDGFDFKWNKVKEDAS